MDSLYKDAVILLVTINMALQNKTVSFQDIKEHLNNEGLIRPRFLEEKYQRMKDGLHPDILICYQEDIKEFHYQLQTRLLSSEHIVNDQKMENKKREKRLKEDAQSARIVELEQKLSLLEQKLEAAKAQIPDAEKRVLAELIRYLDHENYGHVLGKMYRIAYSGDENAAANAPRILNNFFELLKMFGIVPFGELDQTVTAEDLETGTYRLDHADDSQMVILYPGYRSENTIILNPFAGEKQS